MSEHDNSEKDTEGNVTRLSRLTGLFRLPRLPRLSQLARPFRLFRHIPRPSAKGLASVLSGFIMPLMLALALFAGLVYFVFPTTTWLEQRAEASEVNEQLEQLVAEQQQLREDIARLRTEEEVERIARRDFSLVYPGEEAYAIMPAPPAPVSLPASWPFNVLYAEVLD